MKKRPDENCKRETKNFIKKILHEFTPKEYDDSKYYEDLDIKLQ